MEIRVKIIQIGDKDAVEVKGKEGMTVAEAIRIGKIDLKKYDLMMIGKKCNQKTELKDGDLFLLR